MSTGVVRESIDYIVKVELTDPERLSVAGEMAQAYADKEDLERDKKLEVDNFKRRIEAQEAVITRNGDLLRRGYQEHEMECESVKDYGANTLTIYRLDNGEEVSQRELRDDEQQMDMPTDEEPEEEPEEGDGEPGEVPDPPDTSAVDEGAWPPPE